MKIFLLVISVFSVFSYATNCSIENLKTKADIEQAQICMLENLKELETYFSRYEKYHSSVNGMLTKLIKEEGICRKWKMLYERTKDEDYKVSVDDCQKLYLIRLKKFEKVTEKFNKITNIYVKLKDDMEALELKVTLIKNVANLLLDTKIKDKDEK